MASQAGLWYNEDLKYGVAWDVGSITRPRYNVGGCTMQDSIPQDDIPLKRCPRCPEGQQWHPATPEFFHRDKGSKDGLICWCKGCKSRIEKESNQRPAVWNRQKAYRERTKERRSQQGKARYEASKQQVLATRKTQYQVNKERHRAASIKKLYGLTPEEWNALFEQQKGQCAICGNDFDMNKSKFIQVDHCHDTGVIRGLLCTKCNVGLGAFGDSLEMLLKAVQYLEAYQEGSVL